MVKALALTNTSTPSKAENIAILELGPITQIDVAKKLAGEIQKERFMKLDRDLLDKSVTWPIRLNTKHNWLLALIQAIL